MKKTALTVGILVALLAVAALVAVAVFLDQIVKKGVETVGPRVTQVKVTLAGANVSPFSGQGRLTGFVLGNPEGFKTPSAIQIGEVNIVLEPRSIFSDRVKVTAITVRAPEITLEQGFQGNNLNHILRNIQSGRKTEPADAPTAKKFQVDQLTITGGKVRVGATVLGGGAASVPLPEINLTGLGQGSDGITAAELSERILEVVLEKAIVAAGKVLADRGGGVTKDLGRKTGDTLEKASKGVKDIFRRK